MGLTGLFLDTDSHVALASVRGSLTLSRERAAMELTGLFLDTDNHVALTGVSESSNVVADRRLTLASNRRCSPCRCSPVPFF